MLDITFTKPTLFLLLYCIGMLLTISGFNFPSALRTRYSTTYGPGWQIFLCLVLLCVVTFCLDGDFYSYQDEVHHYKHGVSEPRFELIYGYIINICLNNYLLFRITVWGGAILISIYTFKRFKIDRYLALYLLFSIFIVSFYYARASLAMSIYYLGLSFLLKNEGSLILRGIKGILLLIASCAFHQSMLLAVSITPFAFIKLTKTKFISILFIAVATSIFAKIYLSNLYTMLMMSSDEYMSQKLNYYGTLSVETGSLNLLSITFYLRFLLPLFLITRLLVFKKDKNNNLPNWVRPLYNIVLALFLVALVLLGLDNSSQIFFNRILYMTMLGICILLTTLYKNKFLSKNQLISCVLIGIFAQSYRLFTFRANI